MTENYSEIINRLRGFGNIGVTENEPMRRHTTFRIGGNADLFLTPHTTDALAYVMENLREYGIKAFILGNGSNVLFDDGGYRGAVVSLSELDKITIDGETVTAQAGASLISLCKAARDSSLAGLEFAYGIPGSVGGAVYMNAGAYGGEISSRLLSSEYYSPTDGMVRSRALSEHSYGYRDSVYRHTDGVILSASFRLEYGDKAEIGEKMTDYMNRRKEKQPLEYPSAGSVFKRYPGHFTGQMIEECGLKGYSIGGAQVSVKHAGFIINRGDATSSDVLALIEYIKNEVYKKFGVNIECEVIYVR